MNGSDEHGGDAFVLRAPPQLNVDNRMELKQLALEALNGGQWRLVIDLVYTEYIDSAGLAVLVSLSKTVRERGGELRLVNLNGDLMRLFELTKLDRVIAVSGNDGEQGTADRSVPRRPSGGPSYDVGRSAPPDVSA